MTTSWLKDAVSIDYGDVSRIGVIVPSGNVVAETEIRLMLPPGVSVHFTRLPLRGSSASDLALMRAGAVDAAKLLADANVDIIVFHCTAVTTFDSTIGRQISAEMQTATGVPSFSTSEAILSAIRAFRACRAALVTPYTKEIHEREISFIEAHGIDVVCDAHMNIASVEELGNLQPETLAKFVSDCPSPDAQIFFVSCTAIRTAGIIAVLESFLHRPVITSNQAMVWYALRELKVQPAHSQFGAVFERLNAPTHMNH